MSVEDEGGNVFSSTGSVCGIRVKPKVKLSQMGEDKGGCCEQELLLPWGQEVNKSLLWSGSRFEGTTPQTEPATRESSISV